MKRSCVQMLHRPKTVLWSFIGLGGGQLTLEYRIDGGDQVDLAIS